MLEQSLFAEEETVETATQNVIEKAQSLAKSVAKEKAKETLEGTLKQLETGVKEVLTSGKITEYLTVMSKFHRYSFNNCILIMLQCPHATNVAGYKAWQSKFGRQVKKGAKAIRILAPNPFSITKKKQQLDENGNVVGEEDVELTVNRYKVIGVFDVSQTEGKELPTICRELTGDVDGYVHLLNAMIKASPVEVVFKDTGKGAYGSYSRREQVISVRTNVGELQTLKTLAHEIAHALLHSTSKEAKLDSKTKELEAESVAFVVCKHFGFETDDYSFEYIAGWSADKELKQLQASLKRIQKTAMRIIDDIEKHLQEAA